jgi:hypothetical protein
VRTHSNNYCTIVSCGRGEALVELEWEWERELTLAGRARGLHGIGACDHPGLGTQRLNWAKRCAQNCTLHLRRNQDHPPFPFGKSSTLSSTAKPEGPCEHGIQNTKYLMGNNPVPPAKPPLHFGNLNYVGTVACKIGFPLKRSLGILALLKDQSPCLSPYQAQSSVGSSARVSGARIRRAFHVKYSCIL